MSVYFITCREANAVKIGSSVDPYGRLPEIQAGCPLPLKLEAVMPGKGDLDLPATDVLNVAAARNENAEKHLCPMPLNITRRALDLWTNRGDVVLSPFAGVGSEGVASIGKGRRFVGVELNPPYFRQAVKNLEAAKLDMSDLFAGEAA